MAGELAHNEAQLRVRSLEHRTMTPRVELDAYFGGSVFL
jgi:hypothetical protein